MRVEELPEVRNLPLFRSIKSPEICNDLLRQSRLDVVPRRKRLLDAGTALSHLHILLDGYAKLELQSAHGAEVIEVLKPGSMFIMASVVSYEPPLTSATLLTPTRVLFIPAASLRLAMRSDIGLAIFMLDELSRSLRDFVTALADRKALSAAQRVEKHYFGDLGSITGPILTKKDASSLLDLAPQTFSRLVRERSFHNERETR